ncbi:MAG: Tetratricopeptide 2 repeat protein [Acidobacteria bacterium]|nr:Tetratricopeptide 2 repeat protein [Acidobacteriota bacterium]
MKLSRSRIAIVLALLVVTSSGCSVINRIRSKNQLNEAARAYREAHFAEAEQHSRKALELDPDNKTAPLFIARIVHREYQPGINTPENLAKARAAIEEYKRLLEKDPKNEEAYKAVASLLGALKEEQQQRAWILQRANDNNADADKRSEAYVVLASKDWHCSNEITDLPSNKVTTVDPSSNKATVSFKKPKDEKEFQNAKMCVARGLEEIEKAINLDANSEAAWSYKTNLLLEAAKLAEMDGKMDDKAQLDKQREAAQKRTDELSKINQAKAEQKRKEEEAKKAASPPAG